MPLGAVLGLAPVGLCGRTGPGGFFVADFLDFGSAEFAFFEFFFGFFAGALGEFFFAFFGFEFFALAFFEFFALFAFGFFCKGERCGAQVDRRCVRGARREQQGRQNEGDDEELQLAWHGHIHRLGTARPLAMSA